MENVVTEKKTRAPRGTGKTRQKREPETTDLKGPNHFVQPLKSANHIL